MNALNRAFDGQSNIKMFQRHLGWAAAGLLIFAAALWLVAASVVLASGDGNTLMMGVIFGILAVAALLWIAFHESAVGKCLLTLVTMGTIPVVFTLGMPIIGEALNSGWYLPFILPALAAPLVVSAFWWIAAPTPEGRKVLDHIAGFKQYLSITEADRLDRMTGAPQDTPELFEKYLPYAIALGVENHWANRFAAVLAAASARGQQGFGWYSGSSTPSGNPTGFVDSVGSSLSSAVGSASTAPGSGGGGSAGGGGGGGGGGGW